MNTKLITNGALVLLSAIAIGFIVATIVLIIDNNDINDELSRCEIRENSCQLSSITETTQEITTIEPTEMIDYRLPDTVKPILYELYLHPDILTDEEFFLGKVTITLEVLKRTNQIILHSHSSLQIDKVTLQYDTGIAEDQSFEFNSVTEFLVVSLKSYIEPGMNYKLQIDYSGTLKGKLVGFYSSQYLTGLGTMKSLIRNTIQFNAYNYSSSTHFKL